MRELGRVERAGAQRGDAGCGTLGRRRGIFRRRHRGPFGLLHPLRTTSRPAFVATGDGLPRRLHDLDVLRMQLRRHILTDGLLHVGQLHPVAERRQRTQEHRVGDRPTEDGGRDAVGVKRHDARVVERARAVRQHQPAGLKLALPPVAEQRVVQVHHVVSLRNGAAVADGHVVHLGERAHGRATPLGPERGKRQRVPPVGHRRRRTQQPRRCERTLPTAAVPEYLDHAFSRSLLAYDRASIARPPRLSSNTPVRLPQYSASGYLPAHRPAVGRRVRLRAPTGPPPAPPHLAVCCRHES